MKDKCDPHLPPSPSPPSINQRISSCSIPERGPGRHVLQFPSPPDPGPDPPHFNFLYFAHPAAHQQVQYLETPGQPIQRFPQIPIPPYPVVPMEYYFYQPMPPLQHHLPSPPPGRRTLRRQSEPVIHTNQYMPQFAPDMRASYPGYPYHGRPSPAHPFSPRSHSAPPQPAHTEPQGPKFQHTPVLHISGVQNLSASEILHMFSSVADVEKVKKLFKNKQQDTALVQMATVDHALRARNVLHGIRLNGAKIKLTSSHFWTVHEHKSSRAPQPGFEPELHEKLNAKDEGTGPTYKAPGLSNTLFMETVPLEAKTADLCKLFEVEEGSVRVFQKRAQPNEQYALIEYTCKEDALLALMRHQGDIMCGKPVRLAFSFKPIDKSQV